MNHLSTPLLAVGVVLSMLAGSASAQPQPRLKPGAWEITSETDMPGLSPEMMAQMPPQAQEAMKKAMTAARAPQKSCVTANDPDVATMMQKRAGVDIKCTTSGIRKSGATHSWSSSCTGTHPSAGTPIKFDAEHTFVYDQGNTFEMTSKTKVEGMGPMAAGFRSTSSRGRYLGPDCKALGAVTIEERMREAEAQSGRNRKPAPN